MGAPAKLYETTVQIGTQQIAIAIKPMTVSEFTSFRTGFRAMQARTDRAERLKLAAITDEEFEEALASEAKGNAMASEFCRASLTAYVENGDEWFERFGRSSGAIGAFLGAIFLANLLSDDEKKALRSAHDSASSSPVPALAANGEKQGPTADPAEPLDSAPSADVTRH